ncbi:hypothetical protein FRC02_011583 [Tulasnella sp. 418]|nr:hypothetical protein FRC02_011583 [Tulasnella sp. 418]
MTTRSLLQGAAWFIRLFSSRSNKNSASFESTSLMSLARLNVFSATTASMAMLNIRRRKRYLAATTYLSSRSFPSSLLSIAPTLSSSANPHPVLLPIIDVLNHARGHPVSWSVNDSPQGLQFSVIQHKSIPKGFQVLNNYGPKPNNELLLGYGFVLPDNPNDTTILKIGGSQKSWEVGKTGDEALLGLWEEILDRLNGGRVAEQDDTPAWETQLEAADVLSEMTQAQISRLPDVSRIKDKDVVREQVRKMIEVYVEGQRQILDRIGSFAESQRQAAIQAAKDDGIDLVFNESDG